MEQQSSPLKIYFLPFPSPGHMNPMLNLAQIFATKGEEITIITTPSNTKHIPKHFHSNIHTLNFPSNQLNLQPNLENLSSAKDPETSRKIYIATHLLLPQIETFLKQNPPSVFIPDIMFSHDFSYLDEIGITVLPFNPMPIFVACIVEAINNNNNNDSSVSLNLLGDDFPQGITLPVNPSYGFDTLACPFLQAKQNGKKHGIIVNSFAELEEEYIGYYEKLTGVKVWHVGISSLMVELECHDHEIKSNGYGYPPHSRSNGEAGLQNHWTKPDSNGNHDGDHECLSWLNSKEPNSVVYICFGSLCRLNKEQYLEIASGIEGSGYEFLWVVPEDDEEFCVPKEGFKKGKMVRGWAPQKLILNHRAIGGFLTHCGWNSVAEAICAGVPMITMPRFCDQFFNERLVTEVHGIGVEVGAWEWSLSPFGARNMVVVSKEQIEKAVRKVMESSVIRKQAKELQEIACKAVQQGGSSYHNLTTLVQSLKQINLDAMLQAN